MGDVIDFNPKSKPQGKAAAVVSLTDFLLCAISNWVGLQSCRAILLIENETNSQFYAPGFKSIEEAKARMQMAVNQEVVLTEDGGENG